MRVRRKTHAGNAAFFDVDDTLISGYAMVSMFAWLQEEGLAPELTDQLASFDSRMGEFPDRTARLSAFFALLKHQSWCRMLGLGERWFEEVGRDLLRGHFSNVV